MTKCDEIFSYIEFQEKRKENKHVYRNDDDTMRDTESYDDYKLRR